MSEIEGTCADAGEALAKAHVLIEEAARIVTREAAAAPHLLVQAGSIGQHITHRPPTACAMEELTKVGTEIARLGNQVGFYGAWLNTTGEDGAWLNGGATP